MLLRQTGFRTSNDKGVVYGSQQRDSQVAGLQVSAKIGTNCPWCQHWHQFLTWRGDKSPSSVQPSLLSLSPPFLSESVCWYDPASRRGCETSEEVCESSQKWANLHHYQGWSTWLSPTCGWAPFRRCSVWVLLLDSRPSQGGLKRKFKDKVWLNVEFTIFEKYDIQLPKMWVGKVGRKGFEEIIVRRSTTKKTKVKGAFL